MRQIQVRKRPRLTETEPARILLWGAVGLATSLLAGVMLLTSLQFLAHAQDETPHPARVKVVGPANCTEDARLVPVRKYGYEKRAGRWVYRCQNFEVRGNFYRKGISGE